jgi:hypothetical protein
VLSGQAEEKWKIRHDFAWRKIVSGSVVPQIQREDAMKIEKSKFSIPEVMRVIISVLVLPMAFYIVLSNHYDSGTQKWAAALVGSILTYWYHSRR